MIIIQSPVKISPKAVTEIKNILEKKKIPENYGLRIGIKDPSSQNPSHILGFDHKTEADNEYQVDGIQVFIQKSDISHLAGMTVDFYEGPDTRGFVFNK